MTPKHGLDIGSHINAPAEQRATSTRIGNGNNPTLSPVCSSTLFGLAALSSLSLADNLCLRHHNMGFQRHSDSLIVSIRSQGVADITEQSLTRANSECCNGSRQWRRSQLPKDELLNPLHPEELDGNTNAAFAEAPSADACP